jgi:hypothetical protein
MDSVAAPQKPELKLYNSIEYCENADAGTGAITLLSIS